MCLCGDIPSAECFDLVPVHSTGAREQSSRATLSFEEQIMSKDNYSCIFPKLKVVYCPYHPIFPLTAKAAAKQQNTKPNTSTSLVLSGTAFSTNFSDFLINNLKKNATFRSLLARRGLLAVSGHYRLITSALLGHVPRFYQSRTRINIWWIINRRCCTFNWPLALTTSNSSWVVVMTLRLTSCDQDQFFSLRPRSQRRNSVLRLELLDNCPPGKSERSSCTISAASWRTSGLNTKLRIERRDAGTLRREGTDRGIAQQEQGLRLTRSGPKCSSPLESPTWRGPSKPGWENNLRITAFSSLLFPMNARTFVSRLLNAVLFLRLRRK